MTTDEILDHSPIIKGQYKGMTPSEVSEKDPNYLVWMYDNWSQKPCSALLYKACSDEVNESRNQRRVSKDQE